MAAKKMTTSEAVRQVLASASKPMKAAEIAAEAVPLVPGLKGATPAATVAAFLYTQAKKDGGLVKRVEGGFVINPKAAEKAPPKASAAPRSRAPRKNARKREQATTAA